MTKGKSPQHYLSHDALENFEFMWEPVYVGRYDMPKMEPCHIEITENDKFLRFCDWRGVPDPENYIAHFFFDDYKFIQLWRNPEKFLDRLKMFKAVVAPEFSMYIDMPKALRILMCYRRQWLGAFWQHNGIEVIPCIITAPNSYSFCFDGIPKHSVVCISSVGAKRKPDFNGRFNNLFERGYQEMLKRIKPERIIWTGSPIKGIDIDNDYVIRLPSYYEQRRPYLDELKRKKAVKQNERS